VTGEPDDEILASYLPWLRVVAGNMLGFDSPDLQDLVQEGYIAMWRALRSYDRGGGPLDWWLKYKAGMRMKTVSIRAHEKVQPDSLDAPRTEGGEAYADLLEAPDLLERIELAYHHGEIGAAIDRLSPQQRRYVLARFWLGLSGAEMVELGVFAYDSSGLWNSKKNGARWKLEADLRHLASA
jgi:RNA polymerase sigma factor (sigma-70 family)